MELDVERDVPVSSCAFCLVLTPRFRARIETQKERNNFS